MHLHPTQQNSREERQKNLKMMNALALSLVVSSLAAAGVWSPAPQREDVIVKEGHRVIVVEYDEDGKRNTKVSISPTPPEIQRKPAEFEAGTINEGVSAVFPNLGQGISPQGKTGGKAGRQPAGELVCDSLGKCAHEIPTGFGKAKDKISETASDAKEKVEDKVSETAQGFREKVAETAHEAKEKVVGAPKRWTHEARDKVAETAKRTKGAAGDALGKAKEAVVHKGRDVTEGAKDSIDTVKETMKASKDTAKDKVAETAEQTKGAVGNALGKAKEAAKTVGDHMVKNVTVQAENAREKALGAAKESKENSKQAAKKAKTGANKFFDALKYVTSMEALNSAMGMANLLGLATAYGMSVWVTLISSDVLARVLPRQQFGVVQSKIYPVYFRATAYSIGLAFLGHVLGQRFRLLSSKPEMLQALNLLSSLLMVFVNAIYLEPKATKVMFERMKMEKEEGRGRVDLGTEGSRATEPVVVSDQAATSTRMEVNSSAAPTSSEQEVVKSRMARLNERLKKLNTNSSLLNVLTLMALTWHLVYLGQRLGIHC